LRPVGTAGRVRIGLEREGEKDERSIHGGVLQGKIVTNVPA
jgi:hypothetical protein